MGKARESLERIDEYVSTVVKKDSEAGKEIRRIVKEGMAYCDDEMLNIKLADAHGWQTVDAMYSDEILAAAGSEELDKKLRMAQKQVAAEKEAAAKKRANPKGGKGGWYQSWQGGKGGKGQQSQGWGGPKNGCFHCGGPHFARDCPRGAPGGAGMAPWPPYEGKGAKGGKGGW